MALLGGGVGGAGNPVGGSYTGPAQALELAYPDLCYAYSGEINVSGTSEITFFEFTTGNYVAVIDLQYQSSTDSSNDLEASIYLNDGLIYHVLHNETRDQFNDAEIPQRFVIPSYTQFKFTITHIGGDAIDWTAQLTGRIYRE